MKKISTLCTAVAGAALLTSTVFGASNIIIPRDVSPATLGPTATTTGIFADETAPLPDAMTLHNAINDFKNLSKSEKKERVKEVKAAIKQYKKDKRAGKADSGSTNTFLLVIVTILIPPLGVFLHEGEINGKFWIDLILTLLFYIPGLIYGLIVVLS